MGKWPKRPVYHKMWKRFHGERDASFYRNVIESTVNRLDELAPDWRLSMDERRQQLIEEARVLARAELTGPKYYYSCKKSDFDRVFPQVRDELRKVKG